MIIYLDGEYIEEENAHLPITDRGFLAGDGVYATIQVRNGTPLFLDAHIQSLTKQAHALGLSFHPIDSEHVEKVIEKNSACSGIYKLKIILTGGDGPEMHLPHSRSARSLIFLKPHTPAPYAPLRCMLYPHPIHTPHTPLKSLAHLARYFIMQEALSHSLDDAITCTPDGALLETAFGNLCWFIDNTLFTPDPTLPLHFGVTISQTYLIAATLGYQTTYTRMPLSSLPPHTLLFRTNTMGGVRPIISIAERTFPRDMALETALIQALDARASMEAALSGG